MLASGPKPSRTSRRFPPYGEIADKDLVEHGYDVLNVDLVPPRERLSPYLKTDLGELGQVFEVLQGADAVIHLAAIPAPDLQPPEFTFRQLGT